jgi:hypothetical protein
MKFPVNYEFVVPHDHRRLVYYAQSNENSVLAIETNNHRCILVADTADEIIDLARTFNDTEYTAAVTTWHTLTLDWRMALYNNSIVLIKGGTTWQATGIAESPWVDSPMACDPHAWLFAVNRKGALIVRDDAIVIGSSPADLIVNLEDGDDFNVNDLVDGTAYIVAMPLLQIASRNAKVIYRGKVHAVAESVMANTAFLMELIDNPQESNDPEESLIVKMEETE